MRVLMLMLVLLAGCGSGDDFYEPEPEECRIRCSYPVNAPTPQHYGPR